MLSHLWRRQFRFCLFLMLSLSQVLEKMRTSLIITGKNISTRMYGKEQNFWIMNWIIIYSEPRFGYVLSTAIFWIPSLSASLQVLSMKITHSPYKFTCMQNASGTSRNRSLKEEYEPAPSWPDVLVCETLKVTPLYSQKYAIYNSSILNGHPSSTNTWPKP